jgi:hypothetical protein
MNSGTNETAPPLSPDFSQEHNMYILLFGNNGGAISKGWWKA